MVLALEKCPPSELSWSTLYGDKLVIYRPRTGRNLVYKHAFKDMYTSVAPGIAEKMWEEEFLRDASYGRIVSYHLLTGVRLVIFHHEFAMFFCIKDCVLK